MSNANMTVLMFVSVALFAFLLCSSVNMLPTRHSLDDSHNTSKIEDTTSNMVFTRPSLKLRNGTFHFSKIRNVSYDLVPATRPPLVLQRDGEYNISNYTLGQPGQICLKQYTFECRRDSDCIKYNLLYGLDCGRKNI